MTFGLNEEELNKMKKNDLNYQKLVTKAKHLAKFSSGEIIKFFKKQETKNRFKQKFPELNMTPTKSCPSTSYSLEHPFMQFFLDEFQNYLSKECLKQNL